METFKALDKNHDGILTIKELKEGLKGNEKLISQAELDELFSKLDDNKSGGIDYTEFVAASLNRQLAFSDNKILACFKLFDRDQNGKISILEFKNKFQKSGGINDQDWIEILNEADKNGDGEIDFEEFKELLKKMI
jgi:calcium-dependent protein kinase